MKKLLVFATFLLPVNKVIAQHTDTLSDEEKVYGLSLFWKEAKYNFAFFDQVPELDWDSAYIAYISKVISTKDDIQYFKALQSFAALLKDGHTSVSLPWSIRKDSIVKPGVELKNIQGKAIVINTIVDFKHSIPIGSEIMKVNGEETMKYINDNVSLYISSSTDYMLLNKSIENMLAGWLNTNVQITIRTPEGVISTIDLKRKKSNGKLWVKAIKKYSPFEYRELENSIAYIAMNTFSEESVIGSFERILPLLYRCKAVIIDIRNNDGGDSRIGAKILTYFTEQEYLVGSAWRTKKHIAAFKAWVRYANKYEELAEFMPYFVDNAWHVGSPDTVYVDSTLKKVRAPLVVLTGNSTLSAAEDFLIYLNYIEKRATIIGQRTGGSTGEPLMFELVGGAWGNVCSKRDYYPDGRDFVGYGIKPDIEVSPTIQDYMNNIDVVLNRAIEFLKY